MKKILFIIIISLLFPSIIRAENFTWPSDGYIGWKYYTNTNGQEGISGTYHTGIDIWSNTDGGWNNGVSGSSNAVYSAYQGQVVWVDESGSGVIIKHSDSLYTKYWHLKDRAVSTNDNVTTSTLLGYQDYANAVHVHLTVASSMNGYDYQNTLNPSGYFGVELDERKSNAVGWMYGVKHSSCGGVNATIRNLNLTGSINCSANNSIVILPETKITGNIRFFIQ